MSANNTVIQSHHVTGVAVRLYEKHGADFARGLRESLGRLLFLGGDNDPSLVPAALMEARQARYETLDEPWATWQDEDEEGEDDWELVEEQDAYDSSLMEAAGEAKKQGDTWQGQSGRWFTLNKNNRVVPAKNPNASTAEKKPRGHRDDPAASQSNQDAPGGEQTANPADGARGKRKPSNRAAKASERPSVESLKEKLSSIMQGGDATGFADELMKLTKEQVKAVRDKLASKVGQTKAELVNNLVAAAVKKAQEATAKPQAEPEKTPEPKAKSIPERSNKEQSAAHETLMDLLGENGKGINLADRAAVKKALRKALAAETDTPQETTNERPEAETDESGRSDREGSGRDAGPDAGAGKPVAAETEGSGDQGTDRSGGTDSESDDQGTTGSVSRRVAADARAVQGKLNRYEQVFRRKGNQRAADMMSMLQKHFEAVGIDAALSSLGENRGSGSKDRVGYTESAYWSESMGDFTEAYLARYGIVPAANVAANGGKVVSPFTSSYAELTPDFKPAETPYNNKLEEAKDLPGLESSEDISVIAGRQVTHLTPAVTAKLDERYGKGQWIIKTYGDDAFAGQGIFFPQRAEAIARDARSTIWTAGEHVGKYGFRLGRDPNSGKVFGLIHESGDIYQFGTEEYEKTIDGDARQWAERARDAADNENGLMLPNGGKQFMAQPAFPVVGVSEKERAEGKTIVSGEGRVHVVVRNGKAEVIPHSTWLKGEHFPVVFESDETRAMAKAAQEAIDRLPEKARSGQLYAPDIVKSADGYRVVELNAAVDGGGSGYLIDNPFVIDAYISHLAGREPGHVQFIRKLLTSRRKKAADGSQPKAGSDESGNS